jgi:hypothetical protein
MHHVFVTYNLYAVNNVYCSIKYSIIEDSGVPKTSHRLFLQTMPKNTDFSYTQKKNTIELLLFIYDFVFINSTCILEIWRNQANHHYVWCNSIHLVTVTPKCFSEYGNFSKFKMTATNLNLHYRVNRNLTWTKISNIYTSCYFQGRTKRCYGGRQKSYNTCRAWKEVFQLPSGIALLIFL